MITIAQPYSNCTVNSDTLVLSSTSIIKLNITLISTIYHYQLMRSNAESTESDASQTKTIKIRKSCTSENL